ncbi:cytidine deaminase [Hypericibacter adhaerens]|uniref:Cytidine deaminase n=1 Tax=Hypericibacter adhaerens TaxID=2602016 RepID=A0A5J6MSE8_9PROT|nr:anti-phage dCTP deaminase [Hypericibacter adhaerens]QEX20294.1 cytidine deaminase [Hypericibacter adhaerens]
MAMSSAAPLLREVGAASDALSLENRRTPELIIGVVGPIGSGVTYTARALSTILENDFGYTPFMCKASALIAEACPLIGQTYNSELKGRERIERLQTLGNELRTKFGPKYLAEKAVEKIATIRLDRGYKNKEDPTVPLPQRFVHIIDSLKNPAEVRLLRDVYGDMFWLVGVFAPKEIREDRLVGSGIPRAELPGLMERDEDEGFDAGQKVRDTIYEADFFVRNDAPNDERLKRALRRFFDILFNLGVDTPTLDEAAMYTAVSSAASSACLSRQVGAAIYSSSGELIGVGANDVPKFDGGLYRAEDGELDNRCFKWGGKICHNDQRKENLYQHIVRELIDTKLLDKKVSYEKAREALARTDIRNLIEYSRAVHAEMEAIISVARGNKAGIKGSTLYCTTFPCHSCARHIVAAGIRRVIYIEPYPKSLATELHKDAISVRETDEGRCVVFLQYEGVAPKNIVRFFKHGRSRKSQGKLLIRSPKTADPICQPMLDGSATLEKIVVNNLEAMEAAASTKGGDKS